MPQELTTKILGNLTVTGLVTADNGLVMNGTQGPQLETGIDAANIEAKGIEVIRFYVTDEQSVGASKGRALVGYSGSIVHVRGKLTSAPTGSGSLIFDVNKNDVTIFTTQANRPTFAANQVNSTTTDPDIVQVAAGDVISIDVDAIGGTNPGDGLHVAIVLKHSLVD